MGFKRSSRPASLKSSSSSEERGRTGYFDLHASQEHKARSDSYSSDGSGPTSPASTHSSKSHSWLKPEPNVNVYTYCGRHTNQLLFGGPSLTELARSMFKRE